MTPGGQDVLIAPEAHLERILAGVEPLAATAQPLNEALGLCLVEPCVSAIDLPRFDNSSMDGYAVRAHDVAQATHDRPALLPVVGEVHAGVSLPSAVAPGTVVKIMTGAPVPAGADTVVAYESTDRGDSQVAIYEAVPSGTAIRRAGDAVNAGTTVLEPDTVLGPREIGLLASLGVSHVRVRPRPRVVVVSTGDELREPGTRLDGHTIYDGNSHMLAAAVRAAGGVARRIGAMGDDPALFAEHLAAHLDDADLVVTSGGISQGDRDVVKHGLEASGGVRFDRLAMRPGKPQGFGHVGGRVPIITLPGNPVSAFVSFEVFVLPALRRMMGLAPYSRPPADAVLTADVDSPAGLREYVRGALDTTGPRATVAPISGSASHQIGVLAHSNALVVVDQGIDRLGAGSTVPVLALDQPF